MAMKKLLLTLIFVIFTSNIFASSSALESPFAIIADAGNKTPEIAKVKKSILNGKVSNLILPGDNLYNLKHTYQDVWGSWISKGFKFPVVALGNHYLSVSEELRFFNLKKSYYLKESKNGMFIILDSEQESLVDEQVDWLKEQLTKEFNKKIVLVFHHPPVTISYRHNWWEKKNFHNKILPIILKFKRKIDLILVGHDHITSLFTINNIPVVISGATMEIIGTDSKDYFDEKRGLAVKTHWHFNNHDPYWTRLDIAKDHLWINFINAKTGNVECSVKIEDHVLFKRANCTSSK